MNAGSKEFENKLKVITLAYTHLKNFMKDKNGKYLNFDFKIDLG